MKLRDASGNQPSAYIERAVTRQLLADDLRKLAEWEKAHGPDAVWERLREEAENEE